MITYLGSQLFRDIFQRLPNGICRSPAFETDHTTGTRPHLNRGFGPLVDVAKNVHYGFLQLVSWQKLGWG